MLDKLAQIEKEALAALSAVRDKDALESWRVTQLGKKSPLMTVLGELGKLLEGGTPRHRQARQ